MIVLSRVKQYHINSLPTPLDGNTLESILSKPLKDSVPLRKACPDFNDKVPKSDEINY